MQMYFVNISYVSVLLLIAFLIQCLIIHSRRVTQIFCEAELSTSSTLWKPIFISVGWKKLLFRRCWWVWSLSLCLWEHGRWCQSVPTVADVLPKGCSRRLHTNPHFLFFLVPLLEGMSVLRVLSDFHIVHNTDAQCIASSHTGLIKGLNVVC